MGADLLDEHSAISDERLAMRNARLYLAGLAASLLGNSAMSLVAGV